MAGKKTLVERSDRSGVTYQCHAVGDRTYPDYVAHHDGNFEDLLDAARDLELKKGDLFVSGYPKSGNHWFFEILTMCRHQTADYVPRIFIEDFLEEKAIDKVPGLLHPEKPVAVFSHLNVDSAPKAIPEVGAKVVYLARNFKDMFTSSFFFATALKAFIPYRGTWEDFLDLYLSEEGYCFGSWFDHVKQVDVYRTKHPDVPLHVLCYERMKANPVEEIRKLCQFLEVPDTLAEEIADKVHFSKMKPQLMAGKMEKWVGAVCNEGSTGLFRKGQVGDWKNYFTVAQSEMVDKIYEDRLGESPLGQMLKQYMD